MPAHCLRHTQFELDLVCHWQQADTYLFIIKPVTRQQSFVFPSVFIYHNFFSFSFYSFFCIGMPAYCQRHTRFEVYLVCRRQQADTFLFLLYQSSGNNHPFSHQFSHITIFLYFFFSFLFLACQPTVSDTLGLNYIQCVAGRRLTLFCFIVTFFSSFFPIHQAVVTPLSIFCQG